MRSITYVNIINILTLFLICFKCQADQINPTISIVPIISHSLPVNTTSTLISSTSINSGNAGVDLFVLLTSLGLSFATTENKTENENNELFNDELQLYLARIFNNKINECVVGSVFIEDPIKVKNSSWYLSDYSLSEREAKTYDSDLIIEIGFYSIDIYERRVVGNAHMKIIDNKNKRIFFSKKGFNGMDQKLQLADLKRKPESYEDYKYDFQNVMNQVSEYISENYAHIICDRKLYKSVH